MDSTFLREKTIQRMYKEVDEHKAFFTAVKMGDTAELDII